ncbi:MAG: hypothetical protein J2P21_22425 [Chloracidobacterium sp.]|nr:hypothetical protein [Chloracidobacterium sp.]
MQTATPTAFRRVTKRRPCLICGKPDWCIYLRDESLSVCMRVADGAYKVNRHGGAIHLHTGGRQSLFPIARALYQRAPEPQAPMAPIEVRDHVYRSLIRLSPATRYHGALISGPKGLLDRGMSSDRFDRYGGLPASWEDRESLCRQILQEINEGHYTSDPLRGVPGFWKDARGYHLWKETDYQAPRLLIPVRDVRARIQACQMRAPVLTKGSFRYCWLSSSGLPHGTGSGSPLHFNFDPLKLPDDATVVIVEGALKADVLSALRPELYIVANAGVSANHAALINLTKRRRVIIGFDQDYHYNEVVCLRLAALIARRMESERTLTTTHIAAWDREVKGIDDAALRNLPIIAISVEDWFNRLSQDFRRKVAPVLSQAQK